MRKKIAFLIISMLSFQVFAQLPNPFDRFTSIILGTSLEDVKSLLSEHSFFNYRGDPDVSLTPIDQEPIIKVQGLGFIESALFQFKDDQLYSIILTMNPSQLDYYTIYTHVTGKYGEPSYLEPGLSYWEDDRYRMILERPVIMKYLDMEVFNLIRETSEVKKSLSRYALEVFLDNF